MRAPRAPGSTAPRAAATSTRSWWDRGSDPASTVGNTTTIRCWRRSSNATGSRASARPRARPRCRSRERAWCGRAPRRRRRCRPRLRSSRRPRRRCPNPRTTTRPSARASASNVPSLNQVGGTASHVPFAYGSRTQSWPSGRHDRRLREVHTHGGGHGVVVGQVDAVLHREAHEQSVVARDGVHEPGVDRRVPARAEVGPRRVVDHREHLRDLAGMPLRGGAALRLGQRRVERRRRPTRSTAARRSPSPARTSAPSAGVIVTPASSCVTPRDDGAEPDVETGRHRVDQALRAVGEAARPCRRTTSTGAVLELDHVPQERQHRAVRSIGAPPIATRNARSSRPPRARRPAGSTHAADGDVERAERGPPARCERVARRPHRLASPDDASLPWIRSIAAMPSRRVARRRSRRSPPGRRRECHGDRVALDLRGQVGLGGAREEHAAVLGHTPVPGISRYQVRPPIRSRASSTTTRVPASRDPARPRSPRTRPRSRRRRRP